MMQVTEISLDAESVVSAENTTKEDTRTSSTDFGDSSCGEPLRPQHLVIDFTPIDNVDTEFIQKKCCAFWKFVKSRPEIRSLIKMPESNIDLAPEPQSSIEDPKPTEPVEVELALPKETTAVSMLEFVEEKGLIDRTFEAKLPQSMCSLGSVEYEDEMITSSRPHSHKTKAVHAVCSCTGSCRTCKKLEMVEATPISHPEVSALCETMHKWDHEHPKSMDPPGHPPSLSD